MREGARRGLGARPPRCEGSSYALSMKTSGVAHQFHLSRLTELSIISRRRQPIVEMQRR
jgi:hypothetical protein